MEATVHCLESSSPTKICSSTEVKQDTSIEQIDGSKLELTDDADQLQKIGTSPKKLEVDKVSGPLEDAADALDGATEPGLQGDTETKCQDPCRKTSSFGDAVESAAKSGISDCSAANDHRSAGVFSNKEGGNCGTDESGAFLSRIGVGEIDRVEEHVNEKSEDHPADISEAGRDPEVVPNRSDTDLDYDNIDPIEVARLVALEVKREVDCREQSGSSSDRIPGGESQQPDSPDSAHGPQSHAQEDSHGEAAPDLSPETSPLREEQPAVSRESPDAEPINGPPETECSHVTDVAQELPANPEKGVWNFDLNMEVCSDDVDRPENPSSIPISVVSASRAAAAPGMPAAPLQFEGALGWKGSAATSAFRPASPRRIPEPDNAHSTGGSNSSSKQRDGFLVIDLNVDESVDDKTTDLLLQKQIPVSSRLPSGESSVEASPRRSERIEFDLNRANDDGDAPSDWRTEGLVRHQTNGYHSQSPSSSSSSKQPFMRNIDLNLNDQPSFMNESSDNPFLSKLSQSFNAPGVKRSDDTGVFIMGMRVEVNRKDPQSVPLWNGRGLEPSLDVNLGRTGGLLGMGSAVPYTHPPVYGYNGLASGPTMDFSSAMYGSGGPIPYMLDSSGTPVVPQVMGSASALTPVFSHPPFLMGMTNPPALNGAGPSRNSFDLNSGLILEGGNREPGGLRQFLNPGQPRLMADHFNSANSQASTSSGAGVKRKEPDSGWEPYPIKHNPPPPWK